MSEDQFTNLFKYMQERFDRLETKVDAKADAVQLDRIESAVDGITGVLDTQHVEQAAMMSQLNRHYDWIHQLAEKLGVKLKFNRS